jgi:hypothetical protein
MKGRYMTTVSFQLNQDFLPQDVPTWYDRTNPGDIAVIILPDRFCAVHLIHSHPNRVRWSPQGGRGATVSVEDAVQRLTMLQDSRIRAFRADEQRA